MSETRARGWRIGGWLMLAVALWLGTSGIISSNDGSHLALGRALVLRGETSIDPEVALTLWVDRAARDGHQYSDRPPGTAFLALPAIWLGDRLDPSLLRTSLDRKDVVFTPAGERYLQVYTTRPAKLHTVARPILAYQGTALALSLHTVAVGLLGLWAIAAVLRRHGVAADARAFAVGGLGLGTLWGPYATTLFSHGTTATMLALMILALDHLRDAEAPRRRATILALAGAAAAWVASADYLAGVLAAGVGAAAIDLRRDARLLPAVLLGAAPVLAATLAYHAAAFGSPWSIGYDHQANFEFARTRTSTFSGNLLTGLWTLWGLGDGAGALALAPLTLVGLAGVVRSPWRRMALGALPWLVLLSLHKTPAGGGSQDHRYLVPAFPLLGLGLGLLWQRTVTDAADRRHARAFAVAFVVVAITSGALAWAHFVEIRG